MTRHYLEEFAFAVNKARQGGAIGDAARLQAATEIQDRIAHLIAHSLATEGLLADVGELVELWGLYRARAIDSANALIPVAIV